MIIPGINLLNIAMTVIAKQTVNYYKNTGVTIDRIGVDVPTFNSPVPMQGSVQAVQRDKYVQYGLDLQKNYVIFYTSGCVTDLQRMVSGDEFEYGGKRFKCESEVDWSAIDGWTGVLSVEISKC